MYKCKYNKRIINYYYNLPTFFTFLYIISLGSNNRKGYIFLLKSLNLKI